MFSFLTPFARNVRPTETSEPEREGDPLQRRDYPLTEAEAHVAWMAGAPYLRLTDRDEEQPRFASLLVPFY